MTRLITTSILILTSLLWTIQESKAQSFSSQLGGNCYTLAIPDYMVRTYQLNDAASLQYMNAEKNAYVLVIDDDKAELEELGVKFSNANHFLEFFTEDYLLDAANRTLTEAITFNIRTSNLAQTELTWTEEGTDFFMLITAMETSEHLYKILCWSTAANKGELMEDFKKIASSLSE